MKACVAMPLDHLLCGMEDALKNQILGSWMVSIARKTYSLEISRSCRGAGIITIHEAFCPLRNLGPSWNGPGQGQHRTSGPPPFST